MPVAGAGNAQDVLVGRRVQVDWNEHVLLELVEHRRSFLGVVYLPISLSNCAQLVHGRYSSNSCAHRLLDVGNQQDLLARAGVQVHVNERAAVELRRLRLRQPGAEQVRVQLHDAVEVAAWR